MRVTYIGPLDAVELADPPTIVERGETIDLPDEQGARLVEQACWDTSPPEVLAWVGEDRDRAQRMLTAERDGSRRPALLAELAELAEGLAHADEGQGDDGADYRSWSYAQLRAAAKDRGLTTTGPADELIARLVDHDETKEG